MLSGSVYEYFAIILPAILLDRIIGDPPSWPHPVKYIGTLLNIVQPRARKLVANPFYAGIAATILALFIVSAIATALLSLPGFLHYLVAVYLGFSGLALGQLVREGRCALALLEAGDIPGARTAVSYLVSRDVSNADIPELSRVLAETLSENFNDAFVAPLFWFVIGGPVGLWLYKTVSTMDSMWGYTHEPWTRFGTFAARLDDVLAFIPARLTVLILAVKTKLPGSNNDINPGPRWPGFSKIKNDAKKMKSPNAGWPMAATAWIFRGTMGGKAIYAGEIVNKPILGPEGEPWTVKKLEDLLGTISISGFGWAIVFSLCIALIRWL